MSIPERSVAPALGAVLLLALLGLDIAPVALVLLGSLGVFAVATYPLPPAVQAELRAAIAALGLIVLVLFTGSLAFWLVLLALGALGALQARHRDKLRLPPRHTVAWLRETLDRSGGTRVADHDPAAAGQRAGEPPRAAVAQDLATTQARLPGALEGSLSTSAGRAGASALAVLIVLSLFALPAVLVVATAEYNGSSETQSWSYTFEEAAEQLGEEGAATALFMVLVAAALVGVASAVLPRAVVAVTGLAGVAVALIAYSYLFNAFSDLGEEGSGVSLAVVALPHAGLLVTAACFLLITVLQLIPAWRKRRA